MSSHPESDLEDMANLAAETKKMGFKLEQVQDFTPTPMTVATVSYYSGYHPYTLKSIKAVKDRQKKIEQRRFFFWYKPENHKWIKEKLLHINRPDLLKILLEKSKTNTDNKRKKISHPKRKKNHNRKPYHHK